MTRDAIQGFIDGYNKAGGANLHADIADWMANHPVYPQATAQQAVILGDLSSYRGAVPAPVVPTPIVPAQVVGS